MSDATALLDRLALAHALLAAGRTRFALARDEHGLPVRLEDPAAVQFCLTGAVRRAMFEMEAERGLTRVIEALMDETHRVQSVHSLTQWNDAIASDQDALAFLEECAARINPK